LTDPINGMFSVLISQAALEQLDLGAYDHSMIASLGGFKLNIWTGTLTNNAGASR
jgi:hypothetical protein